MTLKTIGGIFILVLNKKNINKEETCMKKQEFSGRSAGCDSIPGERACEKRQKGKRKNKSENLLCKRCNAKDEKGKRISKVC